MDLFATGPINRPKDGIAALSGIIETDWSPYTFTMNWKFTRPNQRVHFEVDEPFCHLFPVARGRLENLHPAIRSLSDNPELEREHKFGRKAAILSTPVWPIRPRKPHRNNGKRHISEAYAPSGAPAPDGHRSRLRLRPFAKK